MSLSFSASLTYACVSLPSVQSGDGSSYPIFGADFTDARPVVDEDSKGGFNVKHHVEIVDGLRQ